MLLQIHLPLEAFSAEVTSERFEACVLPTVRDEVGTLTELLPTNLALVRLLPWKYSPQNRVKTIWTI